MKERPPDDIAVLCSHVDVDPSRYRVFTRELPKPKTPLTLADQTVLSTDPPRTEIRATLSPAEAKQTAPRPTAERRMLRNVLRSVGNATKLDSDEESRGRLAEHVVSVFAAAGGVGATTVSATLSRLFSRQGDQTLIVDGRNDSVVPYYFGSRSGSHSGRAFAALHGACDAQVHILTREIWDAGHSPGDGSHADWLRHGLARAASSLERIVIDVWPNFSAALFDEFCAAGVYLVVAAPDLNSVLGARKIAKFLEDRKLFSRPLYVLNKFDRAQALHVEILEWFERQFPQSPVAILRRTDETNEALAEGLTVVDSARNSGIAEDYSQLADMVCGATASNRRVESA
jgi:MinD-like ATPase involved in chromosome partitioning or flagellar assembly